MSAMLFDTLKLSKRLQECGVFSREQAEELAQAMNEAAGADIANKADISALGSDLQTKIAELKAEMLKWLLGAIGVQTIVIVGALLAIQLAVMAKLFIH
jgi:hypothetical protein